MKKLFLITLLSLAASVHAYHVTPWFGRDMLIDVAPEIRLEHFNGVDAEEKSSHKGINCFQEIRLDISPFREWSLEISGGAAKTKDRRFGYDHFLICARYLPFSDLLGDPLSVSMGLSLQHASKRAVHDLFSYHHGQFECECHFAIGKEWACGPCWVWRIWSALGLGQAERGSPWIWTKTAIEHNWWDFSSLGLLCETKIGLSDHKLDLSEPFHGYGSVSYRAVKVGGYYRRIIEMGDLVIDYNYQPWQRNYPKAVHAMSLKVIIPFGI